LAPGDQAENDAVIFPIPIGNKVPEVPAKGVEGNVSGYIRKKYYVNNRLVNGAIEARREGEPQAAKVRGAKLRLAKPDNEDEDDEEDKKEP
jgi:hypothetical protein